MKTLYLERSVSNGRNGNWVNELDLEGVERIVVGIGPGSFAGIRSALAFAQGFALGRGCEVLGLPSPCAVAGSGLRADGDGLDPSVPLAVVGDSRRGLCWVALFEAGRLAREIFQVPTEELMAAVPPSAQVVTPDAARLEEFLNETFGPRYLGGRTPTSEGLKAYAEANPSELKPEPLPIYLNPAVRA